MKKVVKFAISYIAIFFLVGVLLSCQVEVDSSEPEKSSANQITASNVA